MLTAIFAMFAIFESKPALAGPPTVYIYVGSTLVATCNGPSCCKDNLKKNLNNNSLMEACIRGATTKSTTRNVRRLNVEETDLTRAALVKLKDTPQSKALPQPH